MRNSSYLRILLAFSLFLLLSFSVLGNTAVAYAGETPDPKLNVNSQAIVKGKTFSLHVYNLSDGQTVSFRSSAPVIASVDSTGKITANEIGAATIYAMVKDDTSKVLSTLRCDITVGPPAISVNFSRLELSMTVGQKLTLDTIVRPLNTVEAPKFSSYDAKIASVSAGGRVTARIEGSTYIFAQIDNGRFAVCKVYIYPEGTEIEELKTSEEASTAKASGEDSELTETTENPEDSSEDTAEKEVEVKDPLLKNIGTDFETFLKRINSMSNPVDNTENNDAN